MRKIIIACIIIIVVVFAGLLIKGVFDTDINNDVVNSNNDIKNETVTAFLNNKNLWENVESMKENKDGIIDVGYYFIDINFDGKKELAVQLGGGNIQNCITKFYECINNNIIEKEFIDETYTLDVNNIRKFTKKNGEQVFINNYKIKINDTKSLITVDEISNKNNSIVLETLFSIEEEFNQKNELTLTYKIRGNKVDSNTYYKEYNKTFKELTEDYLVVDFVTYNEWNMMNELEKEKFLEKSLDNSKYEYILSTKNNTSSLNDVMNNSEFKNIVLDNLIYGKELVNIENEDLDAKMITNNKDFIKIVPNNNYLNNEIYYYSDGKLILYVKEFKGLEKRLEYFIKDNKVIFINDSQIKEHMLVEFETSEEIINKSSELINRFF